MGRPTSGVIGMKLGDDDELLAMQVAPAGGDEETTALLVVSDGGFGKRTALKEYRRQGRAGYGVLTAKMPEGRGQLVGALIVRDADEIFAITSTGRRHPHVGAAAALPLAADGRRQAGRRWRRLHRRRRRPQRRGCGGGDARGARR
jgi:DNA gyrase subunit A